jgi:hypothetical protein
MEVIATLITAITFEDEWLAGFGLLGVYLLHGLHTHAPGLFWGLCLFLCLPISLMLLWAASAP